MRANQREYNQLRNIKFTRHYTQHAEGAVLVEFGNTKVLCTVSVVDGVPRFLKGKGQGWLTAEYGMLPRATNERVPREAAKGGQSGRTQEIQRLIGRALRSAVDLKAIGEYTLMVDCDVIQADGGTRTASITGACVALADALNWLKDKRGLVTNPLNYMIAAVSVGVYGNKLILDLDYQEDSSVETDLNLVMNEQGEFIEVQGTAEGVPLSLDQLHKLLELGQTGVLEIIKQQKAILGS